MQFIEVIKPSQEDWLLVFQSENEHALRSNFDRLKGFGFWVRWREGKKIIKEAVRKEMPPLDHVLYKEMTRRVFLDNIECSGRYCFDSTLSCMWYKKDGLLKFALYLRPEHKQLWPYVFEDNTRAPLEDAVWIDIWRAPWENVA